MDMYQQREALKKEYDELDVQIAEIRDGKLWIEDFQRTAIETRLNELERKLGINPK